MNRNISTLRHSIYVALAAIILLAVGVIIGMYIPRLEQDAENRKAEKTQMEQQKQFEEKISKDRTFDQKDFAIKIPAGWTEISPMPSTSATIMAATEKVTDPALQKINFKSYYAITYDTLSGKTLKDYLANMKTTLPKIIPTIKLSTEKSTKVNGQPAYTFESTASQRGADFNLLVAVIQGKNNDVWTLSFNTGVGFWTAYEDIFYSVIDSFIIK